MKRMAPPQLGAGSQTEVDSGGAFARRVCAPPFLGGFSWLFSNGRLPLCRPVVFACCGFLFLVSCVVWDPPLGFLYCLVAFVGIKRLDFTLGKISKIDRN